MMLIRLMLNFLLCSTKSAWFFQCGRWDCKIAYIFNSMKIEKIHLFIRCSVTLHAQIYNTIEYMCMLCLKAKL